MRGGRRVGNPDTRADILAAARTAFASGGYDGTSVRAVAKTAGVDPKLVHHYFGSKRDLFLAVVEPRVDPAAILAPIRDVPRGEAGPALVRQFLVLWEGPEQASAVAMLRTAIGDARSASLLREVVITHEIEPWLRGLGVPEEEVERRAALVVSQMMGVAVLRFVQRVPPLADAASADVVAWVGPTVQRYVDGSL